MSVLTRSALEASPLADLHTIASELGIDGYRRLRKAELVDAVLARQGGDSADEPDQDGAERDDDGEARPRRRRGGGRGRTREADDEAPRPAARRSSRSRSRDRGEVEEERDGDQPERVVEGVVELLGNGSGFLRVGGADGEPSDEDVYISAAQVRRCELVSGDRVSGPVRAPRRSERYASLVRVDAINDVPADEAASGTRYDDLPSAFPSERFALGSDDPTLKAIEWLTPLGRGSRATITGSARAGKSEALRRLGAALAGLEGLEVSTVLLGVRPEEVAEWRSVSEEPAAALTLATGPDSQGQALERAVDVGKRVAARGGHAVLLVDGLDGISAATARRALAAARNIVDGGSLTVIATASQPLGGETTVIALDEALTAAGRFPALDLGASGTLRPELLVGDAGAAAIAEARAG